MANFPNSLDDGTSLPNPANNNTQDSPDNATSNFQGPVAFQSTTTAYLLVYSVGGTYGTSANPTSTVPFTWVSGDEIRVVGTYEAA